MNRRHYVAGLTLGIASTAGCLGIAGDVNGGPRSVGGEDVGRNAPAFEADEDAPGTFILLRQQPQNPNGIAVGDSFEIGLVLGNAGGEPVSGDVSVELSPPGDDEASQTATVTVEEMPAARANMFVAGPFEATVAGDWTLTAGPEIDRTYPEYDETVTVEERPDE